MEIRRSRSSNPVQFICFSGLGVIVLTNFNVDIQVRSDAVSGQNVSFAICQRQNENQWVRAARLSQRSSRVLAIHRASRARCGPSCKLAATAPSNSTISEPANRSGFAMPAAFTHSVKRATSHLRCAFATTRAGCEASEISHTTF